MKYLYTILMIFCCLKCSAQFCPEFEFRLDSIVTCQSINLNSELVDSILYDIQWYESFNDGTPSSKVFDEIQNENTGCEYIVRNFFGTLPGSNCPSSRILKVYFYPNIKITVDEISECNFSIGIVDECEPDSLRELGYYKNDSAIVSNNLELEPGFSGDVEFFVRYNNSLECSTSPKTFPLNCGCEIILTDPIVPIDETNCGRYFAIDKLPDFSPPGFENINVYYSLDSLENQKEVDEFTTIFPSDSNFDIPDGLCSFVYYYFYARVDESESCQDYRYLGRVKFYKKVSEIDEELINKKLCHNDSIILPQLNANTEWVYSDDSITNVYSNEVSIYKGDLLQGEQTCVETIYYFQARTKIDCVECKDSSNVFKVEVKPEFTIDFLEENNDGFNCELNIIACPSNEVYVGGALQSFDGDRIIYSVTPSNGSTRLGITVRAPCNEIDTIIDVSCLCPDVELILNEDFLCSGKSPDISLIETDNSNTKYESTIWYSNIFIPFGTPCGSISSNDFTQYEIGDSLGVGDYFFVSCFDTDNENCQSPTTPKQLTVNQSPAKPEINQVSSFLSGCEYELIFTDEIISINPDIEISNDTVSYQQDLLSEPDIIIAEMKNDGCPSIEYRDTLTCFCPKPRIFLKDTTMNFFEPFVLLCDLDPSIVRTYQWYDNDSLVGTNQSQVISDIGRENYKVRLTDYSLKIKYNDYSIFEECLDDSISYKSQQSVLFVGSKDTKVELYPNPIDNYLFLTLSELADNSVLQVEITKIDGSRIWLSKDRINEDLVQKLSFNLSFLNSGMYFVSIYQNNEILETSKIIKL